MPGPMGLHTGSLFNELSYRTGGSPIPPPGPAARTLPYETRAPGMYCLVMYWLVMPCLTTYCPARNASAGHFSGMDLGLGMALVLNPWPACPSEIYAEFTV
jgi:hypothetical protein